MQKEVKSILWECADQKYAEFSKKLVPECKPMIGVRLPRLRALAKEIVKGKYGAWRTMLTSEDEYFEEVMLRGMMIGYGSSLDGTIQEALELLDEFVPLVDNWSVCDSSCVSFSLFPKYMEVVFDHIQKYLYSEKEFEVRIGLIMLLDHFLKYDENGRKMPRKMAVGIADITEGYEEAQGAYTDQILQIVSRPFTQGYYAQMAAAWLVAECFVTFPQTTFQILKLWESGMKMQESGKEKAQLPDTFTYNKALQKICESKTPDEEVKKLIKGMKCLKK